MDNIVRILDIQPVTHNVKRFRLEKPAGYKFEPGQATEVSVNEEGWKDEKRPFTFTALNEEPYLEFTIKGYYDHDGVTKKIHSLQVGDELILRDVWGTITYQGPGCFIAGGAGITPFIAILRQLHKDNKLAGNRLLFSNRTKDDIIDGEELARMLGDNMVNVLTDGEPDTGVGSNSERYVHGRIDEEFLKKEIADFHSHFYVCGPDLMIADIKAVLSRLGADVQRVVFEK